MKVGKIKLIILATLIIVIVIVKMNTNREEVLELSTEKYENIVPVSKEVTFLKKEDRYLYKKNLESVKTDYKEIKKISPEHLLVKNTSGSWKLIDLNNNEVILPENDEVVSISEKRYVLLKLRNEYFYFDLVSEKEISDKYKKLGDFHENMAMFIRDEKIGYIDIDGREVIKNRFDSAGNFMNGYAIVNNSEERYRYIDKDGKVSEKEYDQIISHKNRVLILADGKENILKVIDDEFKTKDRIINVDQNFYLFENSNLKRNRLFSVEKKDFIKELSGRYLGISEDEILLERDNKIVIYNLETQKEENLNINVEDLEIYKKDYFIKKENNKSYLYNKNAKKLSKGYELIMYKADDKFIVANENGFGVINENGKQIIECKYDSIQLTPDYIIAEINERKTLYNNKGRKVLPVSYEEIVYINKNMYIYDRDGWRYIL